MPGRPLLALAAMAVVLVAACGEPSFEDRRIDALAFVLEQDPIVGEYFDGRMPETGTAIRPTGIADGTFRAAVTAGGYFEVGSHRFMRCAEFEWGGDGPNDLPLDDLVVLAFEVEVVDGLIAELITLDPSDITAADRQDEDGDDRC